MTTILASSGPAFWLHVKSLLAVIYQFVLSWGGPGLFLLAFADSSFLSIPEGNDVLMVVLSTGASWTTMAYYGTMTTLGSVLGCSLLFSVGRHGGAYVQRRVGQHKLAKLKVRYQKWGSLSVLIPSILPPPTPFKIFVLSAGMFGVSFPKFLAAVLIGRSFRYFSWGALAVLYGESGRQVLEEYWKLAGAFVSIMIVSILAAWLLRWRLAAKRVGAV